MRTKKIPKKKAAEPFIFEGLCGCQKKLSVRPSPIRRQRPERNFLKGHDMKIQISRILKNIFKKFKEYFNLRPLA